MNNKAGAIVERAKQAEEAMLVRFDRNAGNPTSVGDGETRKPILTCPELVKFCISSGWSVFYRGHRITLTRGCGLGGK